MRVKLNEFQLEVLSEISRDIAQVSLAGVVVPPLVSGLDKDKILLVISGLVACFVLWLSSFFIAKKIKK